VNSPEPTSAMTPFIAAESSAEPTDPTPRFSQDERHATGYGHAHRV
jgi:hypothetical protein